MLRLRFAAFLEDYAIPELVRPHGPLFHRWLPEGQKDAICVHLPDGKNTLRLWFEAKGFVRNSFFELQTQF